MSLFFVLSGFVIHYNYSRAFTDEPMAIAIRQFLVARFARLYPLYFAGLVLSICFMPRIAELFHNGWIMVACLMLMQTWFNVHGAVGDIISGSWSISTEVFLYLMFIPLAAPLARVIHPLRWIACLCCTAYALLIAICWLKTDLNNVLAPILIVKAKGPMPQISSPPFEWLIYHCPLIRAFEFFIGALAAQFVIAGTPLAGDKTSSQVIAGCVIWVLVVGLVIGPYVKMNWIEAVLPTFLWSPVIVIAMILICGADTAWTRFLSRPFMIAAGDISYSVYLLQGFIFEALIRAFPDHHGWFPIIARTILAVILTTMFSYGTYHLLEVPMRKWIRSTFDPGGEETRHLAKLTLATKAKMRIDTL